MLFYLRCKKIVFFTPWHIRFVFCFVQMSAYYAPAFFGYLLGKCLRRRNPAFEISKLGLVVLGTFAIVWLPYLYSADASLEVKSHGLTYKILFLLLSWVNVITAWVLSATLSLRTYSWGSTLPIFNIVKIRMLDTVFLVKYACILHKACRDKACWAKYLFQGRWIWCEIPWHMDIRSSKRTFSSYYDIFSF